MSFLKYLTCLSLGGCLLLSAGNAFAGSHIAYDPLLVGPAKPDKAKLVKGQKGMVVTAQHLASDIGAQVLRDGGNAVDAAVAVGYAMSVVYPAAASLGGGGFATIYLPSSGGNRQNPEAFFVDYRERAPIKATEKMFLDSAGNPSKTDSKTGWKSVATPGVVAGLEEMRQKWGTFSREKLMAPAIKLAREGFVLEQGDIDLFETSLPAFRRNEAAKGVFLDKMGAPLKAGDRLIQTQLAETLEQIAQKGKDGFYKGRVADSIVEDSQKSGGILSKEDFEQYHVRQFSPLHCHYRGNDIYTAPLPSAGGVALCEIFGILNHYDLGKQGLHSEKSLQLQVEAMRQAYWDRRSLGDGVAPKVIQHVLNPIYLKNIADHLPQEAPKDSSALKQASSEKQETTHYSVIDSKGMAVSITVTLDGWFGGGVLGGNTGVWMNDEMDDFSLKAGAPNMFGIPGAKANAIAPGKTPLSSMAPTIAVNPNHEAVLITGSRGGARIPTIALSVLTGVLDYKMDVASAVSLPRFHEQWAPDVVEMEPKAISKSVQKKLEKKGYSFAERHPWGGAASIFVSPPSLEKHGKVSKNVRKVFGAADARSLGGSAVAE